MSVWRAICFWALWVFGALSWLKTRSSTSSILSAARAVRWRPLPRADRLSTVQFRQFYGSVSSNHLTTTAFPETLSRITYLKAVFCGTVWCIIIEIGPQGKMLFQKCKGVPILWNTVYIFHKKCEGCYLYGVVHKRWNMYTIHKYLHKHGFYLCRFPW